MSHPAPPPAATRREYVMRRLREGPPIVLDGAMGSELLRRGISTHLPLWSAQALVDRPDVVGAIHEDHLSAGAEVITSNTFRTNPRTLENCGLGERQQELTALAVNLAREAIQRASAGERALVAGSMAPVEDCYRPDLVPPDADLEREHTQLAQSLEAAGSDLILVETMNTLREARAALKAASDTDLPVWVSFVVGEDLRLLSGEDLARAARTVVDEGARAVLVNCAAVPVVGQALKKLRASVDLPCGLYPNHGTVDPQDGWKSNVLVPDWFRDQVLGWFRDGARLVGGCCGTTPDHVRVIA
ncbi:MAG: homocysteine S-methyltransferase family protein, partial [Acidobacteriota bacterium]